MKNRKQVFLGTIVLVSLATGFTAKADALLRLYNPISGAHLWTIDTNEYDVLAKSHGWKQEGRAWVSPLKGTPIYRLYNHQLGKHLYTKDTNEIAVLTSQHGYRNEGISYYSGGSKPIYRLYNPKLSAPASHHYTADKNEYDTLAKKHGWNKEGVAFYAQSDSDAKLQVAQANLNKANQAVATAQANLAAAKTAMSQAAAADAKRTAAIKAAETDVKTKADAVNTASAKVTVAQADADRTSSLLTAAQKAVQDAKDALANVDVVTIADLTQFKEDVASGDSDFMTDSGADVISASKVQIGKSSKTTVVDVNNLTSDQNKELALFNLQVINAIRTQLGLSELQINEGSLAAAQKQMSKYINRDKLISTNGHMSGDYFGENASPIDNTKTMYDLKKEIYDSVMTMAFADAPSKWGHLKNIKTSSSDLGLAIGTFAGQTHMINLFGVYSGTVITNPNDLTTLKANLATAEAGLAIAKTTADNSAAALAKASSDYATALELKTKAEKTLASAKTTPVPSQVANVNLKAAQAALVEAQKKQKAAQDAVNKLK